MQTHGYRLVANANSAPSDFIPSLIGRDSHGLDVAGTDAYFEQIDVPGDITVNTLTVTRWTDYEDIFDPIVGVKSSRGTFYIPFSELLEVVIEQEDAPTLELIMALPALARLAKPTIQ